MSEEKKTEKVIKEILLKADEILKLLKESKLATEKESKKNDAN